MKSLVAAPAIDAADLRNVAAYSADVVLHRAVESAVDQVRRGLAVTARNTLSDAIRVADGLLAVA